MLKFNDTLWIYYLYNMNDFIVVQITLSWKCWILFLVET